MIEIDRVTKRYGAATVVDDVSLVIPRGGVTALVGANGAGKSTLLSMIGRILHPDSGTVRVDGMDVARTQSAVLARRLSILRQENQVAVRITVRELIEFGRFPYSSGRLTGEDVAAVDRAIEYLQLEEFANRPLDRLSGGQRQRAFIAMVLAQDTGYLLLDEPLNNLDMRHAAQAMSLIRRMAEELQKTVVVVIHDINFAAYHAGRIIAMKDGRIVADGPPETVVSPSILSDVFDIDVPVHQVEGHLPSTSAPPPATAPSRRRRPQPCPARCANHPLMRAPLPASLPRHRHRPVHIKAVAGAAMIYRWGTAR
ncbi:MAG: ATP-binding cassette domain-containing protein [Thermoflexaceae bacterium]|nr:ATP-binding cassette domain-containing protein [Thermoflexaceae bacterium]